MPQFRFTGTQEVVYVDRALVVSPGEVVDWGEPPADGHWEPVEPSKPATKKSTKSTAEAAPSSEE